MRLDLTKYDTLLNYESPGGMWLKQNSWKHAVVHWKLGNAIVFKRPGFKFFLAT